MATASSAADQALERALDSLSSEKAPPSNERMQSLKGLLQCGLSDPEGSLSRCGHLLYCLKGGGPPGLSDTMTIYDMNRLQCLRDIATELGINVFVAQLEKVVEGTHYGHPDHEFDCEERPSSDSESESEESELDYQPGDLHDEDVRWAVHIFSEEMPAREIALPFPNPGDSPHADLFDGSPPDEEDEEPGVEGRIGYAPLDGYTRYYRRMVLIFIPQSAMTPFLKNFTCEVDNPETQNLIIPLINQCLEPSFDTAALNVLNFFCTRPFQSRPAADTSWSLPDEYTIKVLSMAIQTQNERFYEAICRHIIVNLSPLDYQWAIEIMWDTPLDFKLLQPPLERCVLALPNLAARYRMVVSLDRRGGHRAPRGLREVVRSLADRLVDSCYSEQLVTQDGEILVFIASAFWDFDWLVNRVGPLVRTRIKEVPFILGFICQLYTNDQEGRLHVNDSDVFLASLAWSLLVDLDVRSLISVKGFAQHYERHGMPQGPLDAHGRQTPSPPALTSQDTLLKFARAITSIDPPDSLTMLFVSVLVMQQDRIATDELIDLYIPFIRQLPKALDDCWTISGFPTWLYHKLLCSMVNSFWDRHDAQPRYDNLNWCCSFCTDLKFFLLHPTRQQDAFVATDEEQARHIESVLQVVQAHCSHKVLSRTKQHSRWEVSKLPDRAAEMKAQLQLFDQAELQAAFGVEYGRVTGTAPRTRVTGTAPRTVQPGTSAVSDASHPASTASVLQTHRAQGSLLLPRAPNDAEASQVSSTIRDQPVRSNAQTNSKGNDIEVVPRESQPAVIASRPLAESALASTTRLPLAPVGQNSSQTQPHESRDESSPVVGQKRKEGPDIDCKEARPSKM